MHSGPLILTLLAALPAFASNVQLLSLLPGAATSNALQLDAAGNIYVAGTVTTSSVIDTQDAFAAKLSPDGSKIIYFTRLAGSQSDGATALAVGADGSAYVSGYTQSADFPVTAGALQSTNPQPGQLQGFLVKLNPAGTVVYGTYVTTPEITQMTGIALDSSADVFLTGIGLPPAPPNNQPPQGFILKLDPTLSKVAMSIYGMGGGLLQLDSQGNIYVTGSAQPNIPTNGATQTFTLPSLPAGAFQATGNGQFCVTLGSGPGGPGGAYFCRYQYVAKLNPAGTMLWATYVTGTYGATARGMAVDSAGNVIVAGTTNSDDYPVTPGAFQTAYTAAAQPFPAINGYKDPPPSIGYITKINSTGTGLVWSTYFGGSFEDEITGMAVAPTGDIFISGRTGSSDLPGLEGTPDVCRASAVQELGFVARLAPDGATAGPAQLIAGAPDCTYLNCGVSSNYTDFGTSWPLALRPDGTAVTAGTNGTVASIDFSAGSRLFCATDPADNVQVRTLTPGQLLAIYGTDLASAIPFTPSNGVSTSTKTFGVFFNGIAAPILYSSGQQLNVQVPFELAGQSTVQMQVVNTQIPLSLSATQTFALADRQPSLFLSMAGQESPFPGYTQCGGVVAIGPAALALNADGTLNDCADPAVAGSTVTLFVNGLGQVTPALATGVISPAPAVALSPGVAILGSNLSPLSTTTLTDPGALTGVAQLQFQVPPAASSPQPYAFTPQVLGNDLRERLGLIWVRPH